jgi:hypothetical protein
MIDPEWTTEKPRKPGWHWYRSKRDRLQIIELIEWNNELRAIGVLQDMYSHLGRIEFHSGLRLNGLGRRIRRRNIVSRSYPKIARE